MDAMMMVACVMLSASDGDGREKYLAGDYRGAIEELDGKLQKYPNGTYFRALRGLAWVRLKDAARAKADIAAVLKVDPENGVALLARGVLNAPKGTDDLCAARVALNKEQRRGLAEEAKTALAGTKLVTLKLVDGGPKKYEALKEVRAVTALDVESAKEIFSHGGVLHESICPAQAEAFKKQVEASGAKATVE